MNDTTNSQQSLCQSCGLCCRGVLFEYAKLDKAGPHPDWPADMIATCSRTSFPLPCRGFRDGNCSVYEIRPEVCRSYRCELLIKMMNGEISENTAQQVVNETVDLVEKLYDAMSVGGHKEEERDNHNLSMRNHYQQYRLNLEDDLDNDNFCTQHSKALVYYAKLQTAVAKHFIGEVEA